MTGGATKAWVEALKRVDDEGVVGTALVVADSETTLETPMKLEQVIVTER